MLTDEKTGQTAPEIGTLSVGAQFELILPSVWIVPRIHGAEEGENFDSRTVPTITGNGSGNVRPVKTNFIGCIGSERGRSGHTHVG